jgi:ribonuclease-3
MLFLFSKDMNQNENFSIRKNSGDQDKRINKWIKSLTKLEKKISYSFKNRKLLEDALTHKSFLKNFTSDKSASGHNSETMEFLGDSVLELIVTEFLYNRFPTKNEGDLSKLRSKIICKKFLYKRATDIGLSKYILIGDSGLKNKVKKVASINADAMESLIAAIFLDSSYNEAKSAIANLVLKDWESALSTEDFQNFKSQLQEISQTKFSINPKYTTIKESGPQHNKKFFVEVKIADKYISKGFGNSKKFAEQNAAGNLLKKLKIIQNNS